MLNLLCSVHFSSKNKVPIFLNSRNYFTEVCEILERKSKALSLGVLKTGQTTFFLENYSRVQDYTLKEVYEGQPANVLGNVDCCMLSSTVIVVGL